MRYGILLLAWLTPALIAEALGWNGIWGSGSALVDYLIPVPVAGGVLHVPTFAVSALIILNLHKWSAETARRIPVVAMAILILAQTVQLDFADLHDWLFTDFVPGTSVLRFSGNPLLLFVSTDAFWVTVYALIAGHARALRYLPLLLLLIPATVAGGVFYHKSSTGDFQYGVSMSGAFSGDEIVLVYTTRKYDPTEFNTWLNSSGVVMTPWDSVNARRQAVYFTRSMQSVRWGRLDDKDKVVATICRYEQDQRVESNIGYEDCFRGM